jgi:hypothetical protein
MSPEDQWDPKIDLVPEIDVGAFPESEQESVGHIVRLLGSLWRYTLIFDAALDLFDFAKSLAREESDAAEGQTRRKMLIATEELTAAAAKHRYRSKSIEEVLILQF